MLTVVWLLKSKECLPLKRPPTNLPPLPDLQHSALSLADLPVCATAALHHITCRSHPPLHVRLLHTAQHLQGQHVRQTTAVASEPAASCDVQQATAYTQIHWTHQDPTLAAARVPAKPKVAYHCCCPCLVNCTVAAAPNRSTCSSLDLSLCYCYRLSLTLLTLVVGAQRLQRLQVYHPLVPWGWSRPIA